MLTEVLVACNSTNRHGANIQRAKGEGKKGILQFKRWNLLALLPAKSSCHQMSYVLISSSCFLVLDFKCCPKAAVDGDRATQEYVYSDYVTEDPLHAKP